MVDEYDPSDQSADDIFHEAVRVYLEHVGYGDGLLVDWMLVSAQHMIVDDGSATSMSIVVSREQPIYRTSGLIDYAREKTNQKLVR